MGLGAARGYPGLATCEGIFRGVWENLLDLSLRPLKFRFMELYMLWKKLKRWGLLMSGWNVILFWFVLCLLLGQMFLGCFGINEILILITVEKSGIELLIFFVKEMQFHWYNRLPYSMFLKFFMNKYSLLFVNI